jgi:predicted GNAT family acetyltransferase
LKRDTWIKTLVRHFARVALWGERDKLARMTRSEFAKFHVAALQRSEIRHNLMLALLARLTTEPDFDALTWTLGDAGACAILMPGKPLLLGDVSALQCADLAEQTRDLAYSSVVGPDQTALWFADHAAKLGIQFNAPVPQRIYSIRTTPLYPQVRGAARSATSDDIDLLYAWICDFVQVATHDVMPTREQVLQIIASNRHMLWIVDGVPVSMAAINRRIKNTAAIGAVYTPPEHRQKGYAGAVTSAVVERIYSEGKTSACLYTDLRNPYSNRCYIKIGFAAECDSMQIVRRTA